MIKKLFTAVTLLWITLFLGCASYPERKVSCPGSKNLHQVIEKWNRHSTRRFSLRAYGRCHTEFETSEKSYDENFSIKLWAKQPENIYLQGDIFFNPKGIIFGTDGKRFWFGIKPEVDTFVSGKLPVTGASELPAVQMVTLSDCLFINEIRDTSRWSLQKGEKFDILSKNGNYGKPSKKIYLNRCDHLPEKIEYYRASGKVGLVAKIPYYRQLKTGEYFPLRVSVEYLGANKNKNLLELEFGTIKKEEFSKAQEKALFNPPDTSGFDNVYRLVGDELEKMK